MTNKKFNEFERKGFYIEKKGIKKIFFKKVKSKIFKASKNILKIKCSNEDKFFNSFHKLNLSPTDLNLFRQQLNKEINEKYWNSINHINVSNFV